RETRCGGHREICSCARYAITTNTSQNSTHVSASLRDAWSDAEGKIHLDEHSQDCENFEWKKRANTTKFTFTRKFDTCDEHDYVLERGTTHLVWLKGAGPLASLAGLSLQDAKSRGMSRTELLRWHKPKPAFPSDAWRYEIKADRVQVPSQETTYWCRVQKLPATLRRKHHVLQFGPAIQSGNEHLVHHMEVFHCAGPAEAEVPDWDGPCDSPARPAKTQICKKVLAAWAMGADDFVYPQEAGLPIGGPGFNRYIMLEVHYNNPELQAGAVDSSGIGFWFTRRLRRYDAGVIELGLEYTDKMAVPPGQVENQHEDIATRPEESTYFLLFSFLGVGTFFFYFFFFFFAFTFSNWWRERSTASGRVATRGVGLGQAGIKIFGSQLHTHLTGRRVLTRHVRDGEELPLLNYDRHYSTHFQEIRLLPRPVTVLPVKHRYNHMS
ncbi:unnamed protein product, partial [Trichogramma brassicae]